MNFKIMALLGLLLCGSLANAVDVAERIEKLRHGFCPVDICQNMSLEERQELKNELEKLIEVEQAAANSSLKKYTKALIVVGFYTSAVGMIAGLFGCCYSAGGILTNVVEKIMQEETGPLKPWFIRLAKMGTVYVGSGILCMLLQRSAMGREMAQYELKNFCEALVFLNKNETQEVPLVFLRSELQATNS